MPRVIPPAPSRDDEYFWTGVGEGRLLARRCAGCAYLQHPPSPMCPKCGSVEWHVTGLAGTGSVYSWIVSRHPSKPDDEPRIVALIELDEGIRMVSNLPGIEPADVRNGMRVEVGFDEIDGVRLPQFRPAAGEAGERF
jgi:3-oxo-4,17-pregnadiene-20-carboxyl-CoA hydratase alpha subunit